MGQDTGRKKYPHHQPACPPSPPGLVGASKFGIFIHNNIKKPPIRDRECQGNYSKDVKCRIRWRAGRRGELTSLFQASTDQSEVGGGEILPCSHSADQQYKVRAVRPGQASRPGPTQRILNLHISPSQSHSMQLWHIVMFNNNID